METTVGARLKFARNARNLTQRAFAAKIKTDQSLVGKWERGEASPGPESRSKIVQSLRISPSWLYDGEGPMDLDASFSALHADLEPDGSTSTWIESHAGEAQPSGRLYAEIAALDSPARAVLEQMLDACLSKVRRNQTLSNDEVAQVIQTIRNLVER